MRMEAGSTQPFSYSGFASPSERPQARGWSGISESESSAWFSRLMHQGEQISITSDEIFGLGYQSQIDIWGVFGVSLIVKLCWHIQEMHRYHCEPRNERFDVHRNQSRKLSLHLRTGEHVLDLCHNLSTQTKLHKAMFCEIETRFRWTGLACRSLEKNHTIKYNTWGLCRVH